MECDVSPSLQVAANAQTRPPASSIEWLEDETDARPSFDGPPLETCKRELDAVLASLDV